MLSGHTHGGQICLPRIGPVFTHSRAPRFTAAGPWKMAGQRLHVLGVVHNGEAEQMYYHSSPTRSGDWFHTSYPHWPVYQLGE